MPGEDLLLSNDGDYVDDGAGAFELTTTAQPALRHQLLDRVAEWTGDPGAGREIRGIAGRLNTEEQAELEAESVRVAHQPLVDAGQVADVEVQVDRDTSGRWVVLARARDTQSGNTLVFDNLSGFGV